MSATNGQATPKHMSSDGYGTSVSPFELPLPALPPGWRILNTYRLPDGEHVVEVTDLVGRRWRWLEDEAGLEWAWRSSQSVL
jgi:hypothetical protein